MAEWDRNKVSPSEINNGKQFTRDDDLTVQELNAMVNNSFYGVDFAENMADQPDISEINSSGSPEVSIIDNVKNGITYKKFKFKNLKGERGQTGAAGANGESATISTVTAEISSEAVDTPEVKVQLGGTELNRTFHFVFKGILGGSAGGSAILYNELGDNTNGALTQKKSTEELNKRPTFVETEEVTITVNRLLDLIFPVGSLRLSDNGNEENFMGGTWIITGQGRTIIGAGVLGDNNYSVGDLIEAGLPNITGEQQFSKTRGFPSSSDENTTGALGRTTIGTGYLDSAADTGSTRLNGITFDASKSNPIYGKSNTVHMNSFVTYIYKRIG